MDVLFVNPPHVRWRHGNIQVGCRAGSRWPWTTVGGYTSYVCFPFFLSYAASYLQQHGVATHVFDTLAHRMFDYGEFFRVVEEYSPQIVVIETSTPTFDIDMMVARRCSRFAEVALAGPHATIFADELITLPYVHYILRGEYELSALDMWQSRRRGIYDYRIVDDIDMLPWPYRDTGVLDVYWDSSPAPTPRPQLQVYASRGCPYRCTYCMWPPVMYQNRYRPRRPEAVADEIRFCRDTYGSKSVFFDDDTFNIGTERISRLCDELLKIGLPWTMMGRLDTSPEWLFDKMVDSGCVGMRFGVETFSAKIQKNIRKGLDIDKAVSVLCHLDNKYPDLPIHITTMCNLPGESQEDRAYNLDTISRLGFDNCRRGRSHQLSTCIPFPGTALYQQLLELGYEELLDDVHSYDGNPEIENALAKVIVALEHE